MSTPITGAAGHLGGLVVDHLLATETPPAPIVATGRDIDKLTDRPERREHRGVTVSTSGPGVDTDEMVLIHRVIRREFGQLPRLFRSAANDPARSKIIGFMPVVPAPARLAYKLIGHCQFTRETTAIRG